MASDSGADAELRERVAALEQTVAEQQHHSSESPEQPSASRRGFLSAAAAAAGLGALGIYSSYPASAQAAGQVGTSSEPVDVEAWSLNVQDKLAGDLDAGGNDLTNVAAAEVGEILSNSQKVTSSSAPKVAGANVNRLSPLFIRGSNDGAGLILQSQDDTVSNGEGRANIYWYSAGNSTAPERLAAMEAEAADNEFSVYTKADALGSGSTGLEKRINIPSEQKTKIEFTNSLSDTVVQIGAADNSDALIKFGNNNDGLRGAFGYNAVNGLTQWDDLANNRRVLFYNSDFSPPYLSFNSTAVSGLREISNPAPADMLSQEWAWDSTNSRWLYKDSSGTSHYFTPDGTL